MDLGLSLYLVVDLGNLDRVRGGAFAVNDGKGSRASLGVGDMVLVVGAVEVLSVPAAA